MGDDNVDPLPNRFLRGESKKTFGGRVPSGDDAVEVFGHDRVVGRLHRRDEELLAFGIFPKRGFGPFPLADIDNDA